SIFQGGMTNMANGNKGVKGRTILRADGDVKADERHKLPQWLADEADAKSTALELAGQNLNAANRNQKSAAGRLKNFVRTGAGLGPVREAVNDRKGAQAAHDGIVNRVGLLLGATLPGSLFEPLLGNYGLKARKARSAPKPRAIKKLSSVTLPDGTLRLVWSG